MERCYDCNRLITSKEEMYETKNGEVICIDCYSSLSDWSYELYKDKNLLKGA